MNTHHPGCIDGFGCRCLVNETAAPAAMRAPHPISRWLALLLARLGWL
jgi:hypothetical protein